MLHNYQVIFLSGHSPFTLQLNKDYYKHGDVIEVHNPNMLEFQFKNSLLNRLLYKLTGKDIFKPKFVEYINE